MPIRIVQLIYNFFAIVPINHISEGGNCLQKL
jgi:hypothetical protein